MVIDYQTQDFSRTDTKFDFIAAKRAGIKFIFANYGYGKNTPLYKYKINKVKDILNLI